MSDLDYKTLGIPYFKEIFDIVDEVLTKRGIPYYLIGANALAINFLKEGKKPPRGTRDIDFAIMISTEQEYETITQDLVARGFKNVDANYRFYYSDQNVVVDILPFGKTEEIYTDNFVKRDAFLYAFGLQNVLAGSEPTEIDEKIVGIPPFAGMILLKLIAYSDHYEWRQNDLMDILAVIEAYYDMREFEILDTHHDTFQGEHDFDTIKIAARVLGREAGKWLRESEALKERTLNLLDENLRQDARSPIAEEWARRRDWEISYAQAILRELKIGLTE